MNEIVEIVCKDFDSNCKLHLYGGTLISWVHKGEEVLFLSSKTNTKTPSKAIRGGVPIVFPNFGPWDCGPQHGFARIQWWKLKQPPKTLDNGAVQAQIELSDNEETRAMWNHRFRLIYTVTLADNLKTELEIENQGEEEFTFTCLLHTYFLIPSIANVTVSGLQGLQFQDKVKDGETFTESRDLVTVAENVDRIYMAASKQHVITGHQYKNFTVDKHNLPDTVVWNPWAEKAAAMSDFGDEEYHHMICIEPGYVSNRRTLQPKQVFLCGQEIKVVEKSSL